jgi:hypothetical protein
MIPPDKHLQIGSSRAGRRPSIGRWHHLLPFFGAVAVNKRVVMDGKHSICRWRHLGNRRRAQGVIPAVSVGSLVFLALLGIMGAKAGGAAIIRPTIRVVFWGALAMAITAGIGALVGRAV